MAKRGRPPKVKPPEPQIAAGVTLLPCPFCGGTDLFVELNASDEIAWCICENRHCRAIGPTGNSDDDRRASAIAAWNKRIKLPADTCAPTTREPAAPATDPSG